MHHDCFFKKTRGEDLREHLKTTLGFTLPYWPYISSLKCDKWQRHFCFTFIYSVICQQCFTGSVWKFNTTNLYILSSSCAKIRPIRQKITAHRLIPVELEERAKRRTKCVGRRGKMALFPSVCLSVYVCVCVCVCFLFLRNMFSREQRVLPSFARH